MATDQTTRTSANSNPGNTWAVLAESGNNPASPLQQPHYPAFRDLPENFRSGYLPSIDGGPPLQVPLLHYGFLVPKCIECLEAAAQKLGMDLDNVYADRWNLIDEHDLLREYDVWGPLEDRMREHVGRMPSTGLDLVSPRTASGTINDADRVVAIYTNRASCRLRPWFDMHSDQRAAVEDFIKEMLALPADAQPMWYFGPTSLELADFHRFLQQLQPYSSPDGFTKQQSAQAVALS